MNFNVRIQEEFKAGISYVECARIRVPVFVQVCIPECMRASVKRRENLKDFVHTKLLMLREEKKKPLSTLAALHAVKNVSTYQFLGF